MADTVSLGLNRPSALSYLIAESILPEDADESSYHWHARQASDDTSDEELLYTPDCVVWSVGANVKKVFRFDGQDRKVVHALLTTFPGHYNGGPPSSSSPSSAPRPNLENHYEKPQRTARWGTKGHDSNLIISAAAASKLDPSSSSTFARALVIAFATELQVHFLSGPSHVVSLPFEIQDAHPSYQGIVIQRKPIAKVKDLPSPRIPPPPPNSFFSSQAILSPQARNGQVMPSLSHVPKQSDWAMSNLDALFHSLKNEQHPQDSANLPLLYTLTDPLSDVSAISHASFSRVSRFSSLEDPDEAVVDYDPLDSEEESIYVSAQDELGPALDSEREPLLFMVTKNRRLHQINIWQYWYLKPQTLSKLLSHRAAQKASRIRQRGSFASGTRATNTSTPSMRHRDRIRESLAASIRLPSEFGTSVNSATTRNPRDDEEAMASQMDPDYLPLKQPTKTSKRVSSILARAEVANSDPSLRQTALGASFGGGGRRGPSIGSFHERRSIGSHVHRKSRGSTPGSVFNRSIGHVEELTESMAYPDKDDRLADQFDSAQALINSTRQTASMDSALGGTAEGSRKDLITRKLDTIPLHWQAGHLADDAKSEASTVKVFPVLSDLLSKSASQHIDFYVLDKATGNMITVSYRVRTRGFSSSDTTTSGGIPVPITQDRKTVPGVHDMIRLRDGNVHVVLCSAVSGGLSILSAQGSAWPLNLPRRTRLFDPTSIQREFNQTRRDYGRTRTTELASGPFRLNSSSRSGNLTLTSTDGTSHHLQMKLYPQSNTVRQLLQVCQFALGGKEGKSIATLWRNIYHRFTIGQLRMTHGLDLELEAFLVTLFALTAGSIGKSIPRGRHEGSTKTESITAYESQMDVRSVKSEITGFANRPWGWLSRTSEAPRSGSRQKRRTKSSTAQRATIDMSEYEAMARHFLQDVTTDDVKWLTSSETADTRTLCAAKVMLALHLYREESRLDLNFGSHPSIYVAECISAVVAQFGHYLGLEAWSCKPDTYYGLERVSNRWTMSSSTMRTTDTVYLSYPSPPSVYEWIEQSLLKGSTEMFISLGYIASMGETTHAYVRPSAEERLLLPRQASLQELARQLGRIQASPVRAVEIFAECGLSARIVETFPEAILAPIREAVTRCQSNPPTIWSSNLLRFVGRDDLISLSEQGISAINHVKGRSNGGRGLFQAHDMQTVYAGADRAPVVSKTHEAERHAVISLIFSEDRRFVDTLRMMNPTAVQIAECPPQPEWSEVEHLDQQKRVVNWAMVRTIALAPGFAMIHFESQRPLLSEHFLVKGFSTSCQMKPMDTTVSVDRSTFTEERFGWAFFHSGVSAGLSISQDAKGIDTSWIVFNKPSELGNRHAGFLLALGINGHLRTLAKWLAFKYLTPKHNMTSIGLLLGLSASHIGTMDSLITRMLSVHITRMLPSGAAELNVSPSTQTAGLMGIGLLYFNTQHRRMSEVMLSEIEHREIEDPGSTMDTLRDESYRLAAGFALGYINLGKGRNLQGLRSMHLLERLLNVAIGSRPVDLVHVVDKATAGAVIAVTLVYMKTGDKSVAQKIDIPDTIAQLEHVRPDLLLLRTLAKHLIMWNEISDEPGWVRGNLPKDFVVRYYGHGGSGSSSSMKRTPQLKTEDVPFFNIVTGLAWSLGLRYAGSGNHQARDDVLGLLKVFNTVAKQEAYYYDAKLTRNTVRRCIDVLGLSAATIMAGTGDLETFRHLRALHGRVDPETSYGSHMAAHLAIGALFMGGGTYTFGTSDFAIAALICAFYPLFPSEVSDNRVHLQAFRHLWVFAAEPRCLVVQDIDTARPISMKVKVLLKDGRETAMTAPCLLPELSTITRISTHNPSYWQVTFDFVANPDHLSAFRRHQTIHVRRSQAYEASSTVFSSALTALNDVQCGAAGTRGIWRWIVRLAAFRDFDQAVLDLVLPPDAHSAVHLDEQGTVCDTRLTLGKNVEHFRGRDELWNLKALFSWAQDAAEQGDGRLRWIGRETIDMIRAKVAQRMRSVG